MSNRRVFTFIAVCLAWFVLNAMPAFGQGKSAPSPPPSTGMKTSAPSGLDEAKEIVDSNGNPMQRNSTADNCFLPPLNSLPMATTSVADLQIPPKTQHEFDDGCTALRNKKATEAESHLRKALKQNEKFAAAWVLLGQVLEAEQKIDEARDACSKATSNASYVPAYLCLADISARTKQWDDVLKLSGRALELDPTTDAPAYSYNAAANFNLHHLPEAEKSALRAIEIDKSNKDPRVHFLLAQIYEAKGDTGNEAAQLREYLKYATDPNDIAMVKSYLAALDGSTK
jgi:tetratricopeptide (TPR) repeat protein